MLTIERAGGLLLAAIICAAQPAHASEIADAKALQLDVRGRIAEHCALGTIGDVDFGDLRRQNLAATAKVALNCNVPFDLSIKARNGALAHSEMPNGQGPYAGRLAYSLGVDLPIRRPQSELLSRTFNSQALLAGQTMSSAGGIAVDGMTMRLTLAPPSGEVGLLAGKYGEVIEITVSPL